MGAAYGFFLNLARQSYDVKRVELSTYASRYAKEKLRLDVFNGTIQEVNLEPSSFEIVAMWDVVEHLTDPILAINEINRVMKPSGLLALSTPNVGSILAKLQGKNWRLYDPHTILAIFHIKQYASS